MRKEKLAWWEKSPSSVDLKIRAPGAEGEVDETTAGCMNYRENDYIFFIETKEGDYTTIKHPTKKRKK